MFSLKGINPKACFKYETKELLTHVLRLGFQRKCMVNQMWKYEREMNISLSGTDRATFCGREEPEHKHTERGSGSVFI